MPFTFKSQQPAPWVGLAAYQLLENNHPGKVVGEMAILCQLNPGSLIEQHLEPSLVPSGFLSSGAAAHSPDEILT